jgi:broad specificity phosphatase PhoE
MGVSCRTATVLLIRHADVAAGRPARLNGWHDVGLTTVGERQVVLLRGAFAGGPPLDAAYASPLQREGATARALPPARRGAVRLLRAAREIGCGAADGLLAAEAQLRFPAHWAANLRQDDDAFRWPGGESCQAFRRRCVRLLDAIAARHPGERIALVTHAGVVATVLGAIAGIPPARWEPNRPGNTGVTELRWRRGGGEVVRFDDRSHLAAVRTA